MVFLVHIIVSVAQEFWKEEENDQDRVFKISKKNNNLDNFGEHDERKWSMMKAFLDLVSIKREK